MTNVYNASKHVGSYIYRIVLLAALAFAPSMSEAQTHRLERIITDYDDEMVFHYDDKQRVDSITQFFVAEDLYYVANKFFYDENGNNIKEHGYQILNGDEEYTHTITINYEFNEKNQVISRTNYNYDVFSQGGLVLDGVYVYVYNDKDQMSERKLFWDEERTRLGEVVKFEYNEKGQKVGYESTSYGYFSGVESPLERVEYVYDENGNPDTTFYYEYDDEMKEWSPSGHDEYLFDESGNLLRHTKYNGKGVAGARNSYTYELDVKSADTSFPINFDGDEYGRAFMSEFVVCHDTIYAMNLNDGQLVVYDVRHFEYGKTGIGVEPAKFAQPQSLYAHVNGDDLSIGNLEKSTHVRLYDASGRLVKTAFVEAGEVMDIGGLPDGVYCLSTHQGVVKFKK